MISLRPLKDEDIAQIEAWPPYGDGFEQMDYALRQGGWIAAFKNRANTWLYIAESDNQAVGFTLLSATSKDEAEFRIAVHPQRTGMGFGREMTLQTLRTGFQSLGMHRIHLIVRKNNDPAMKLYERLGFRRTGQSVHVIQGQTIDFFTMDISKDVFVALYKDTGPIAGHNPVYDGLA